MCRPPRPPPDLFFASPGQVPGYWLVIAVAAAVFAFTFIAALRTIPVGYLRRQAVAVFSISYALIVLGLAFNFLSLLPWEESVGDWYLQQYRLLLAHDCPHVSLDAAQSQATALGMRLDLIAHFSILGGLVLLFVWGFAYIRGKL
jgi:hypothetical protein